MTFAPSFRASTGRSNICRVTRSEAIAFLKKYTRQEDEKILDLLFENSTMKTSTDGVIKEQWVVDALAMTAKMSPEYNQFKPNDLFVDQFFPVTVN